MGEKGTGMQFLVLSRVLGEECPHSHVGGVDIYQKLMAGVRDGEDGCRYELTLKRGYLFVNVMLFRPWMSMQG